MYLDVKLLQPLICDLLKSYSVYECDADITAQRLIEASLRGDDPSGVEILPNLISALDMGDIDPRGMTTVVKESPAMLLLDGNQSLGMVSMTRAIDLLIPKIQTVGVGVALIKKSQMLGAPAVYVEILARQGFIGYCVTSTGNKPSVNWPGTQSACLGSHPSAWAFPSMGESSTICMCAEMKSQTQSETTSNNHVADHLPGVYQAMVQGLITGVLAGGKFPLHKTRGPAVEHSQHLILGLNPEFFGGTESFMREWSQTQADLGQIVSSTEGTAPLPGMSQHQQRQQRSKEGIPVSNNWHEKITAIACKRKIPVSWPA
jgi:LDH2 family malate/lactate/ureidoglycolate dehydrogenase